MPQTGHGQNLITKNNIGSYNQAVNSINKHQKENVQKLNNALNTASSNNALLSESLSDLNKSLTQLKVQAFANQVLIDNWDITNPNDYVFPTEMLA